ncbi:hypothetical protein GQ42DRAFT_157164 [Ramicandelaber brevisporus]|nr:hypothetical protein GQ42DRAFT_157164 [Ramicandelaber brevisporus]
MATMASVAAAMTSARAGRLVQTPINPPAFKPLTPAIPAPANPLPQSAFTSARIAAGRSVRRRSHANSSSTPGGSFAELTQNNNDNDNYKANFLSPDLMSANGNVLDGFEDMSEIGGVINDNYTGNGADSFASEFTPPGGISSLSPGGEMDSFNDIHSISTSASNDHLFTYPVMETPVHPNRIRQTLSNHQQLHGSGPGMQRLGSRFHPNQQPEHMKFDTADLTTTVTSNQIQTPMSKIRSPNNIDHSMLGLRTSPAEIDFHKRELESIRSERDNLKHQLSQVRNSLNDKINGLEAEIGEYVKQANDMQHQIRSHNTKIKDLESNDRKKQAEHEILVKEMNARERQLQQVNARYTDCKRELDHIKIELREFQNALAVKESELKFVNNERDQLSSQSTELRNENNRLKIELDDAIRQLKEFTELNEQLDNIKKENVEMKLHMLHLESELVELRGSPNNGGDSVSLASILNNAGTGGGSDDVPPLDSVKRDLHSELMDTVADGQTDKSDNTGSGTLRGTLKLDEKSTARMAETELNKLRQKVLELQKQQIELSSALRTKDATLRKINADNERSRENFANELNGLISENKALKQQVGKETGVDLSSGGVLILPDTASPDDLRARVESFFKDLPAEKRAEFESQMLAMIKPKTPVSDVVKGSNPIIVPLTRVMMLMLVSFICGMISSSFLANRALKSTDPTINDPFWQTEPVYQPAIDDGNIAAPSSVTSPAVGPSDSVSISLGNGTIAKSGPVVIPEWVKKDLEVIRLHGEDALYGLTHPSEGFTAYKERRGRSQMAEHVFYWLETLLFDVEKTEIPF